MISIFDFFPSKDNIWTIVSSLNSKSPQASRYIPIPFCVVLEPIHFQLVNIVLVDATYSTLIKHHYIGPSSEC